MTALGAVLALLVAAGTTEAALTRIALAVAVIAFAADLVIALASLSASAQTEARLNDTNIQVQVAVARVDERTEEIRALVRTQGKDMLDIIGQRAIEAAPEEERPQLTAAVGQLREQLSGSVVQPPRGNRWEREQRLVKQLAEWAASHQWRPIEGHDSAYVAGPDEEAPICVVEIVAASTWKGEMLWRSTAAPWIDDWPERSIVLAMLVEERFVSEVAARSTANETTIVVTPSMLDELDAQCIRARQAAPGQFYPYGEPLV